jgi:putative transposase
LPTSTRTIYQILKRNQRIASQGQHEAQEPLPRPEPLSCWQIDFKDIGSIKEDQERSSGKKQHIAEAFNVVDEGTSILLHTEIRTDFTAETLLRSLAAVISRYGLPCRITLDRDPRSVGAPIGSDFPSALLRFGLTLGIEMHVCTPHHPQENGFVERYHRSYQQECLSRDQPTMLEQARQATEAWIEHYHRERPHQGISCANQPPLVVFPTLPHLPAPPASIEADGWLEKLDGFHVQRKVNARGMVYLDLHSYYVGVQRRGERVTLQLQAQTREVAIWQEATLLKTLPLKGLLGDRCSFERFVDLMAHQARAFHRLHSLQERRGRMH